MKCFRLNSILSIYSESITVTMYSFVYVIFFIFLYKKHKSSSSLTELFGVGKMHFILLKDVPFVHFISWFSGVVYLHIPIFNLPWSK